MALGNSLLAGLVSAGPLLLSGALLVGALGLPLPGTLLVLATGALAQQGLVDGSAALFWGAVGVILGDVLSYGMGRVGRSRVQQRIGRSSTWRAAQETFARRGGAAVYLTRFLFTPLAVPTNLIAGSSLGFGRFLVYDVAGEVTWLLLYGGLGFAFSAQTAWISQVAGQLTGWLTAVVVVVVTVLWRYKR